MEKLLFILGLLVASGFFLFRSIKILRGFLAGYGVRGIYKPFGGMDHEIIKTKNKFSRSLAFAVGFLMYPLLGIILFIWALILIRS